MKRNVKVMLLVVGTALVCAPVMAKKKKTEAAKTPPAPAAPAMDPQMMEKFKAYATPGAEHQALTPLAGTFSHTMTWWQTPNAQPEISTGTTQTDWILGGRFLESRVTGTSMGQPFEGRGIIGYDNEKKQYDTFWIDNMATGMMTGHGQFDAATKTLTETDTASCPIEHTKTFRMTTKITDDNNHTVEMFTNDKDGKEFRMMQITYVRRPA